MTVKMKFENPLKAYFPHRWWDHGGEGGGGRETEGIEGRVI